MRSSIEITSSDELGSAVHFFYSLCCCIYLTIQSAKKTAKEQFLSDPAQFLEKARNDALLSTGFLYALSNPLDFLILTPPPGAMLVSKLAGGRLQECHYRKEFSRTNPENDTSRMNAIVKDFASRHSFNNSSLVRVSFYSKLELYNPSLPLIAQEIDFNVLNREQLINSAFEKFPLGSVLFSAVKPLSSYSPVLLSRKDRAPFLFFSSNVLGAFGCEPPAGFYINENKKTVRKQA